MKIRKRIIYLGGIILLIIVSFSSCFQFRMSEKRQMRQLHKEGIQPTFGVKVGLDRKIHYTLLGQDSSKPMIVVVHGSPGSSSNFLKLAKDSSLLSKYQVLLLDRPGFGYSEFGKVERSIIRQAKVLNEIWPQFNSTGVILLGHSLGGPIVARMAMDALPENKGILLLAGSVSPELEPDEPWRKTMDRKVLSWLMPRSVRASNREILAVKEELYRMEPYWKNIRVPVVIMHGEKDNLVPVENADYAAKMLLNAPEVVVLKYPELNHFIPFSNPELVVEELLRFPGF